MFPMVVVVLADMLKVVSGLVWLAASGLGGGAGGGGGGGGGCLEGVGALGCGSGWEGGCCVSGCAG
jgi:hypothetical protein